MSICPFVSPGFFSGMGYYFKFYFFFQNVTYLEHLKTDRVFFFPRKFIIPQIWIKKGSKRPQNKVFSDFVKTSKHCYWYFTTNPTHGEFWFYSYGSQCCWTIKLQDSLKCIIPRKKWTTKFIFDIQIDKLTLHHFGFA